MADEQKIPLWRDTRVLNIVGQAIALVVIAAIFLFLWGNLNRNFQQLGLTFGFGFLSRPASFGIGDTAIAYTPTDPYSRAVIVGLLNSLRVMILGIVLATIVGIIAGVARLSDNWLVRQIAAAYVETFRNTPLLLQLFFWYFALFLNLPSVANRIALPGPIFLTQRGLDLPWPQGSLQTSLSLIFLVLSVILAVLIWRRRAYVIVQRGESGLLLRNILVGLGIAALFAFVVGLEWQPPVLGDTGIIRGGLNLSPEFSALLFGLVFYTAAFIAEVVRAGIQSVTKGQWEAAKALGFRSGLVMQLVIFPQALRVMVPPLTSEYLNLAKNSSLAIAVGYTDVYAVANTTSNQTGRSVEMLLVVMSIYLIINLIIALGMNWFNASVQLQER